MRTIGLITVGTGLMAGLALAMLAIKTVPDIRHYRRIRKM